MADDLDAAMLDLHAALAALGITDDEVDDVDREIVETMWARRVLGAMAPPSARPVLRVVPPG